MCRDCEKITSSITLVTVKKCNTHLSRIPVLLKSTTRNPQAIIFCSCIISLVYEVQNNSKQELKMTNESSHTIVKRLHVNERLPNAPTNLWILVCSSLVKIGFSHCIPHPSIPSYQLDVWFVSTKGLLQADSFRWSSVI